MWFVHSCLSWHGTCKPQSWADLGEFLAGAVLVVLAAAAAFLGLWVACDWLDGWL